MATSVVGQSSGGVSSTNMLPASYINVGESPINGLTYISSLDDADILVNSRIRSDGTFNCYLGEEITINDGTHNAVWQVVGVDTELGKGDIPLTQHHISLVPKTVIGTSMIHSSNADCHGYANSNTMYAKTIPSIVSSLETVLGDHLLTRRVKLTNATSSSNNKASGNGYYSVKANLMCQMQVFGTVDSSYGNSYDTGDDTEQLPGFKTGKVSRAVSSNWWWLRDVYGYGGSYYYFSGVNSGGSLGTSFVDNSNGGVRPLITVG